MSGELMKPIKVPVTQLRQGMMIVAPPSSWITDPFVYGKSGIIKSVEEISHIIACGFTEAYYDPDRSDLSHAAPLQNAQQTPLAEELCRARDLYFDAFNYIKSLMQEKKIGAIEVSPLRGLVNEIVQSLHRNFNALLLITTIKKTNDYTYRHSINVAIFSIAFSQFLGLDEDETFYTGMAGLFHDYGKAFVPQQVLNAPRGLNPQETTIVRSHVRRGHESLKDLPWINSIILDGILHHHERHDGTGYPQQLSGDEISLHGGIISICDVYDALTSLRVYKDAIPPRTGCKKTVQDFRASLEAGPGRAVHQTRGHFSCWHGGAALQRHNRHCLPAGSPAPPQAHGACYSEKRQALCPLLPQARAK